MRSAAATLWAGLSGACSGLLSASLFNAHLLLTVAPDSIAVLHCHGYGRRRRQTLLGQWHADGAPSAQSLLSASAAPAVPSSQNAQWTQLQQQLHDLLTAVQAGHVPLPQTARIIIADDWARYFLVTPPHNSQRLADCEAAAQMRLQMLYGDAPQAWAIQGQWQARQPFLACALPRALLDAVHSAVRNAAPGCTLLSTQPHFIANWNQARAALAADSWLLLFQDRHAQLAVLTQGRLQALRHIALDEQFWQQRHQLLQLVQREALRLHQPLPPLLQLCGRLPPDWQQQDCGTLRCEALSIAPRSGSSALQLVQGGPL